MSKDQFAWCVGSLLTMRFRAAISLARGANNIYVILLAHCPVDPNPPIDKVHPLQQFSCLR